MKIKTWLLITYLVVMLFPLVALYGLYVSINAYYEDKNVEDYFERWQQIGAVKETLLNPALYDRHADFSAVEQMSSEEQFITLYKANGMVLYASNPIVTYNQLEQKERLYKDLYELTQNYGTFIYKEPVYENGMIVGVFKVTLPRTEWTEQVKNRTAIVVGGLIGLLVLLYGAAVYFLNRRLNRPLKRLIAQMQAFAKGEKLELLPIKKDEIGELTESFQNMQREIVQARECLEVEQRQKAFMMASLSHDLKTPLTSIQAYTESLLAGKMSELEQQEYLQVIASKSVYMKQLVEDLMMFSLLQSPSYEMELVVVDGEEFFEMLLQDYEQVSLEKGFVSSTYVAVHGNYAVNPKQLMRVVDNIVANAWTYAQVGTEIRLAVFDESQVPSWCEVLHVQKSGAYIVVQNRGATLTKEQTEQMFEPLCQLDEARNHGGAGLGLAIAKQIIEKHDGTIEAVSQQGEVAIVVYLPKEEL